MVLDLRIAGALLALGGLGAFFLFGGNDSNNTLGPRDLPNYNAYAADRGILALGRDTLLPIANPGGDGREYGLHPAMAPLVPAYDAGDMAILCNVGTLVAPITKAEYQSGGAAIPPHLFSHNDQQVQWQTSVPDSPRKVGWGGRIADLLQGLNAGSDIKAALAANPLPEGVGTFPNSQNAQGGLNRVASQLRMILRMIHARQALGMKRQIFFAALGGFDTHDAQLDDHAALLLELSSAIADFHTHTGQLAIADKVTLFTASDFNRTYNSNGKGSDHAWGGHHLIVGGAVNGGRLYGEMPVLQIQGPDDTGTRGSWIPKVSTDEMSATLARWFGVAEGDLPLVLPNIGRFSRTDLGFMQA